MRTTELDDIDVQIVLTLADNNMNESETARRLFMHRNTVIYHLDKVYKITGLDPTNFYDLGDLVQMARTRRVKHGN